MKRILFVTICASLFTLLSCQTENDTLTRDEARNLSGQQDLGYDVCEKADIYSDNVCDDFCPNPDSDCGTLKCNSAGVCPDGYWCKLQDAALPLNGIVRNCLEDGQCEVDEDCEYQGGVNRIPACDQGYTCNGGMCQANCKSEWTFLVYLLGDNNLESAAVSDLDEMLQYGSNEDVNIVVQVDRSSEFSEEGVANLPDWTDTKRLYVNKGQLEVLEEMGEIDMGKSEALSEFIKWGINSYPAEKYAIVLWDHGGGWFGYGSDDGGEEKSWLYLSNIAEALKNGLNGAGVDKVDLLGFDACLMANLESVYELSPYARYIVASEETEPGFGWDYTGITKYLSENHSAEVVGLANAIVDSYKTDAEEEGGPWSSKDITLSIIDTQYIEELVDSVHAVAGAFKPYLGSINRNMWIPVALSRSYTEEYGVLGDPDQNMNDIDLLHFLEQIEQFGGNNDFSSQIEAVKAAHAKVVLRSIAGSKFGNSRPHAQGLSIYFPYTVSIFDRWNNTYENTLFTIRGNEIETEAKGWHGLLSSYQENMIQDSTPPSLSDISFVADDPDNPTYLNVSAQLTENIEDVTMTNFFLGRVEDNGDIELLYRFPIIPDENNGLEFKWYYMVHYITDGTNSVMVPLIYSKSSIYDMKMGLTTYLTGNIEVEIQIDDSGEWTPASISFTYDTATGEFSRGDIMVNTGGRADDEGFIIIGGSVDDYEGRPFRIKKAILAQFEGSYFIDYVSDTENTLAWNSETVNINLGDIPEIGTETWVFGFTANDFSYNLGMSMVNYDLQ